MSEGLSVDGECWCDYIFNCPITSIPGRRGQADSISSDLIHGLNLKSQRRVKRECLQDYIGCRGSTPQPGNRNGYVLLPLVAPYCEVWVFCCECRWNYIVAGSSPVSFCEEVVAQWVEPVHVSPSLCRGGAFIR